MRLPKMRAPSAKSLSIADFSGGLNLRDGMSEILNNQLTDSVNMWWKDGVLKNRPGMGKVSEVETAGYDEYINPKQTDIWVGEYRLFYYNISGMRNSEADYSVTETFGETGFWLQGVDKTVELPTLKTSLVNFVCQKNNTIYAFIGESREIWKLEFSLESTEPEVKGEWVKANEEDKYVPTVYSHCKTEEGFTFSGTMVESYNLIGNKFKMIYSTVNQNISPKEWSPSKRHDMQYPFPVFKDVNPEAYLNKTVTATITDDEGTKTVHTVTFTEKLSDEDGKVKDVFGKESDLQSDGLLMTATLSGITFYHSYPTEIHPIMIEDIYVEDNLEIIIPYIPTDKEFNKIFNMTRTEWFGGASAGLAGGTRLFLCGNTGEQSLVCWSGLNDPLYFPENSYFYVGNTSSAVTGFGKQSDKLIIFKENETWYTQYYQNTDITADDLINQSVVDYTASSVYFPLVQINPNIGCPYPNTVQLCRNRLVWLGSGRKVYTLVTENQYNERSIYCVSDMISPKLRQEQNLNKAVSADFEGLYLLFVQNNVYVMDYESYGYIYIYSHTKTEDAQLKIPWWYWELSSGEYNDEKVCGVIELKDRLYIVFYPEEPNGPIRGFKIWDFSYEFTTDGANEIESSLTTKLFNFSAPQYRKNIDRIDLALGNNGGDSITAEIITDSGSEEHIIELTNGNTDNKSGEYLQNKAIFPCLRQVSRMAVKLSSQGPLILDGMSIKYRITGGVR